jgi:hypothetical protein
MKALVGVMVGLLAVGAVAQDVKDGEKALRDAVLNKQRFLRGFNADAKVHWEWDGTSLVQQEPTLHTFGVLVANSVKVNGSQVEIEGERHTLLRSGKDFTLSVAADQVLVTIDLKDGDAAKLLPMLADLIFYPSMKSALADTTHQPADVDETLASSFDRYIHCDCRSPTVPKCGADHIHFGMDGTKPPSFLTPGGAKISRDRRKPEVTGAMELSLTVNVQGEPTDIWLSRPTGKGLDERSGVAVNAYRFKPGTCHGQVVPMELNVNVSIQLY